MYGEGVSEREIVRVFAQEIVDVEEEVKCA
jgi:hypothetical protein